MKIKVARLWRRGVELVETLKRELWDVSSFRDQGFKGRFLGFVRVLHICFDEMVKNRIFGRAGALSYASLMGFAPFIAIIVLVSGNFVQTNPEEQIKKALLFIAPSLQEYGSENGTGAESENGELSSNSVDVLIHQIVEGAEASFDSIDTGGSTTFSLLGGFILIAIVIQLLTTIETSFNQMWGVKQGRPWSQRIVFYWTFISLGAVLGISSTAILSAGNIASVFSWLPLGETLSPVFVTLSPFLSFLLLLTFLILFYSFFPNTQVPIKCAASGASIAAILLILNNYFSILYVNKVISLQSFYGSVGIIPVLMFGLYFFWVFILLGAQLTYAVQNARFLFNERIWRNISPHHREMIALAAYLQIARHFNNNQHPATIQELSEHLQVPVSILNEALHMLEEGGWIVEVQERELQERSIDPGYHPASPLHKTTLAAFKRSLQEIGESRSFSSIDQIDPLVATYLQKEENEVRDPFFTTPLQELLDSQNPA